jgi:YegS/Rv2252/BmrU family lipid kinase
MKEKEKLQWLVVVNPNAGVGRGEKDWKEISRLLEKQGLDFYSVFTKRRLHAMQLVEKYINKGYRKIVVVGGDGTMNEAVNGIFNQQMVPTTEITLGMIPVGTGNDWVRTFNIPTNYKKVVKIIKRCETILQDAGTVKYLNGNSEKNRFFINMAGLGFDGLVAQRTNYDKDHGRTNPFIYIKNLITSLFSYKSSQLQVFVDDNEVNEKVFSLSIAIGQYNGGGMQQAPGALPDDGLFDVTLIKDMSKWSVITSLRQLYNGTIGKHKRVITMVGKIIRIYSEPPVLLETDGESLGSSPFEFQIIPKSIRVIVNINNT